VIEDHIENNFDFGAMKRSDHVSKFIENCERSLPRTVRVMRREE
jgi:hypothetical protein